MKKIKYKYTIIIFFYFFINIFFGKNYILTFNEKYIIKKNNHSLNNLNEILKYKAEKINNNFKKKTLFLNQNVELQYQDLLIYADYITINWETGWVYGRGKIDSTGKINKLIYLTQKKNRYNFTEFNFNYILNIGEVKNLSSIQNNKKFIFLKKIQKINNSIIHINRGFYTTDKYYINKIDSLPDYHIKINKTIYNKKTSILLGLTQLYINSMPIKIKLPFLYIYHNDLESSSILPPEIGQDQKKGFFIKNLGYYYLINKYINLKISTNLFSNQDYQINNKINYNKKNKYYGYFIADYSSILQKHQQFDHEYNLLLSKLEWIHQELPSIKKNWIFSSNMKFIKSQILEKNLQENIKLHKNLLDNYEHSIICLEKYSLNRPLHNIIIFSYNQYNSHQDNNHNIQLLNVLPIYNFKIPHFKLNIKRQFPFLIEKNIKNNIINNLNINYTFDIENNIKNIQEEELFTLKIFEKINNHLKNHINITTKYLFNNCINIFFGFSYKDSRNFNFIKTPFQYNSNTHAQQYINKLLTSYQDITSYFSIQTFLIGKIKYHQKNTINTLKHIIIPKINYTFKPNNTNIFENYYQYNNILFKKNINNSTHIFYHQIDIEINNKLQVLIKNKKNNGNKLINIKKIKLLDNLLIQNSYNFSLPFLKWGDIIINSTNSILNDRLKINFNINMNPYKIANTLITNNKNLYIINNLQPDLLKKLNFLLKYSFNNNSIQNKKIDYLISKKNTIDNKILHFENNNYTNFYQKWNLDLGINYNYSKENFITKQNTLLYFNTNIYLNPYLKIEYSTNFDVINKKFISNKIIISHNLRSFQLHAIWSPLDKNENWSIFLGINNLI